MNTVQLTAILPATGMSNARNHGDKKETIARYVVITYSQNYSSQSNFKELVDCRVYRSYRSDDFSPVYASIWLSDPCQTSGMGSVSGLRDHKQSVAIQNAINSAGVQLSSQIDDEGDLVVREALKAIAFAMGYTNISVIGRDNSHPDILKELNFL